MGESSVRMRVAELVSCDPQALRSGAGERHQVSRGWSNNISLLIYNVKALGLDSRSSLMD
jgi:hypothetical protein